MSDDNTQPHIIQEFFLVGWYIMSKAAASKSVSGKVDSPPIGGAAAAAPQKGLFTKKDADGNTVMRDRTKAGLAAGGGLLLFTDAGGNIVSGAVGQATENVGKIGGSFLDGLGITSLIVPVSLSSSVFLSLAFMFFMLTKFM
jgi:hypothetical protein